MSRRRQLTKVLQKGRDNLDQPLWRQQKGSGWLFSSGPDGFWRFANSDMATWHFHLEVSEIRGPQAGTQDPLNKKGGPRDQGGKGILRVLT